jgi:hypothetical protein
MRNELLGLVAGLAMAGGAAAQSEFVLPDPPVDFEVIDMNPFDGFGDTGTFSSFNTIGLCPEGDVREMAEFDLAGVVPPEGEVVVEATLEVQITSIHVEGLGVENGNTPDQLSVYGYAGDGVESIPDFEAGEFLASADTSNPFEGQIVRFDVTEFVGELLRANERYAGLALRGDEIGLMAIMENGVYPRLTILTDVGAGCYADFTDDGVLDLFDFLAYVNSFNDGGDRADCTGEGTLDLFDFLCFVNEFNEGC